MLRASDRMRQRSRWVPSDDEVHFGGGARWGPYTLKWWAKTQPALALSSGEAELASIVRATSEGLGLVAVMSEFAINVKLIVKSDACAAIGIVRRQGLGRVRHLSVADLWVQQRSKSGEVQFKKLPGSENTSDVLTKAVENEVLMKHMAEMGFKVVKGRHPLTPDFDESDILEK